jgi:gas vesicle protein
MADRDEIGSFLVGFIVGGLAGAVAALLFAPQSGEETRTLIKEKTIELRDKASETVDEAYAKAEAAAIEARARFEDLAKATKERAAELSQKGQVLLEEQKARFIKPKEEPKTPAASEG